LSSGKRSDVRHWGESDRNQYAAYDEKTKAEEHKNKYKKRVPPRYLPTGSHDLHATILYSPSFLRQAR